MNDNFTGVEILQPLFIGTGKSALYACHHEPNTNDKSCLPILICPPIGHEYERCHRALKQLASQLAKNGFHVLRFDYSGTGDSAGDYVSSSVQKWQNDINTSVDFLKQRTGSKEVAIIGLRHGATLAFEALKDRQDVAALCLWSPILSGKSLMQGWLTIQCEHEQALGYEKQSNNLNEVMGYPMADEMIEGLSALSLNEKFHLKGKWRCLCLIDHRKASLLKNITNEVHQPNLSIKFKSSESVEIWCQQPMQAVVPFQTISEIKEWLQEVMI